MRRLRMRRVTSILRQQDGMAVVMALGILTVLSAVGASLLSYTSANSRNASRSDTKQRAYAAAEAGVNSAVAMLGLSTNNALDPCLLNPPTNPSGTTCASNTAFSSTYNGGTVQWYGTLDQTQQQWTVRRSFGISTPSK